jgi:hypothetical protein
MISLEILLGFRVELLWGHDSWARGKSWRIPSFVLHFFVSNLSNNFSIFYPSQFHSNRNVLVFEVAFGKVEVNPHVQTPPLSSDTTRENHTSPLCGPLCVAHLKNVEEKLLAFLLAPRNALGCLTKGPLHELWTARLLQKLFRSLELDLLHVL